MVNGVYKPTFTSLGAPRCNYCGSFPSRNPFPTLLTFSISKSSVLEPVKHGSLNVPIFHITQPLGIWSINVYFMATFSGDVLHIPKSWDSDTNPCVSSPVFSLSCPPHRCCPSQSPGSPGKAGRGLALRSWPKILGIWVCLKMVSTPKPNG